MLFAKKEQSTKTYGVAKHSSRRLQKGHTIGLDDIEKFLIRPLLISLINLRNLSDGVSPEKNVINPTRCNVVAG